MPKKLCKAKTKKGFKCLNPAMLYGYCTKHYKLIKENNDKKV